MLARELIARTRVARLLAGYRDRPPADLDAICDVLIALSQLLADLPELAELDINPLLADDDGVIALDARVRRRAAARRPAPTRFAIRPYPAELAETRRAGTAATLAAAPDPARGRAAAPRASSSSSTPEDLRLRFFSARRELPRSELARLTQIDYDREMAFIAARTRRRRRAPRRSAWCAPSPTPTTSRPSSRSSCAPTSRAAGSAAC